MAGIAILHSVVCIGLPLTWRISLQHACIWESILRAHPVLHDESNEGVFFSERSSAFLSFVFNLSLSLLYSTCLCPWPCPLPTSILVDPQPPHLSLHNRIFTHEFINIYSNVQLIAFALTWRYSDFSLEIGFIITAWQVVYYDVLAKYR